MNMESHIDTICKETLMFPIFVSLFHIIHASTTLFHIIHASTTINAINPQYYTVVSLTNGPLIL